MSFSVASEPQERYTRIRQGILNQRWIVNCALYWTFARPELRLTTHSPTARMFNRMLAGVLSRYVSDNQKDWDVHLPHVLMAYRSSVHEATKYSLFFLMFGRKVRLPVDATFGCCPDEQANAPEYVAAVRSSLETAHDIVRQNLNEAQRRQKDYYDSRVSGDPYSAGDRVWLHSSAVKRGTLSKLASSREGPYQVLESLSDVSSIHMRLATARLPSSARTGSSLGKTGYQ